MLPQKLSALGWTPIRHVTLHLSDQRGAASLRHRNRAEITVSSYVWTKALSGMVLVPAQNPRGGDSAYEKGGDARRKFWIKPLKETDLGVAQAFFDP